MWTMSSRPPQWRRLNGALRQVTPLSHDVSRSLLFCFWHSAGHRSLLLLVPGRRRPDKGWGALTPALLAASTILPMLLSGLAALAGKALMSSVLALAVAGFNLFRSGQGAPAN